MADTNLNILVRVQGAKEASTEIVGISKSTAQVGKQTEETSKRTSNLRKTMSGLATGFAVYKGAQWIKSAVNETTALAKSTMGLQRITGMDAKTAAGWVGVAKERGVQSKQLNMGFITLAKNTEQLAKGGKSAVELFHGLGISAHQFQSMNAEQRMLALADAFKNMKDPAQRAATAQKLFGRQAQTMIPLLSQGSKALGAQIDEMGKSSGMTGKSVKEQLALVRSQREMNRAMLQLKVAVATALMPIMLSLAQVLAPLTAGFAKLMQGSGAFRVVVVALTAAMVVFIATMKLMQLAAVGARTALMTSGIGAIVVGIAVAIMLLYTKCGWFRDAIQAAMKGVVAAFGWVKNAALAVWNWIKGNWPLLLAALAGPFGIAAALIIKHWHAIANAGRMAFAAIKGAILAVWNWIKANWPLLVSILTGPIGAAVIQIVKNWGRIKSAAESAFNAIKSAVNIVGSIISGVLGGAFRAVLTVVKEVVSAIEKVVSVAKGIASLPGKAGGAIAGAFKSVSPFQTGGYMHTAGTALVGEQGPEMVHLPQGARVSPFVQGYGGSGRTVVQVPVYLDRRQIALAMGSFVADQQAAR